MMAPTPAGPPDRLAAVARVLARHRLQGCDARAAGSSGEVLLLRAHDAAAEAALASPPLLDELRGAGFRYVALDLEPRDDEISG